MSVYQDNLDCIRGIYPEFIPEIAEAYSPDPHLLIEESRSGVPCARFHERYLHSRHDPVREAARLVQSVCGDSSHMGVFLGFGLGYQVEAFIDRFPEAPLLIIEKEPTLFLKALSVRDYARIFSKQVSLLIGSEVSRIAAVLASLKVRHMHLIPLGPLVEEFREYYGEVQKVLQARLSRQRVNEATLRRFGRRWIRNLRNNLEMIETAGDVRAWKDTFTDFPALVIAAGPSLDEILPLIHEISERTILISSDTAVRALQKRGIDPDFIIVVDPQYWNSRHLDGLDLSESILISESATHPDVFRHVYRSVYFSGSVFPLGSFLEGEEEGRHRLGAGGSVATTAWDFARFIGAEPILTAGLDLGFPEERPHFRGCYFEERLFSVHSRTAPYENSIFTYMQNGDPFPAESCSGASVRTDRRLIVYKQWFEEQLSIPGVPQTYSLSPRSLKILGIDLLDPRELLSWPLIRNDIMVKLEETLGQEKKRSSGLSARLSNLKKDLLLLRDIARRGLSHTGLILEKIEQNGAADLTPALRLLDDLDQEILHVSGRQVVAFLITPLLEQIENTHDPNADLRSSLLISHQLYRELLNSSEYHLQLFSDYPAKK